MNKPSGPTLIFIAAALLAALGGAVEHLDLAFVDQMRQWMIVSAAFAVAFYLVLDCGFARRSKK